MGRKMMRLGKPLELLQAALRAAQNTDHFGEQITTIGRQLAYAAFLTYDSILWASGVKFINLSKESKEKVGKIANRFWLTGILLNLAYGLLKAGRLADEIKALRTQKTDEKVGDDAERNAKYHSLLAARAALRYQFIIDSLDVWIPAANLGFVHSNDGILGFLGTISSIMALRNQWRSAGKK
jgi:peroxin-11B